MSPHGLPRVLTATQRPPTRRTHAHPRMPSHLRRHDRVEAVALLAAPVLEAVRGVVLAARRGLEVPRVIALLRRGVKRVAECVSLRAQNGDNTRDEQRGDGQCSCRARLCAARGSPACRARTERRTATSRTCPRRAFPDRGPIAARRTAGRTARVACRVDTSNCASCRDTHLTPPHNTQTHTTTHSVHTTPAQHAPGPGRC